MRRPDRTQVDQNRTRKGAEGRTDAAMVISDRIRSLISDERLEPETHLPTEQLAARFGVSRWPVEQALKALTEHGSVVHRPRRGFFVRNQGIAAIDSSSRPDAVQQAYLAVAEDLIRKRIERQVSESFVRERYSLTRGQASALFARLAREGLVERRPGYGWAFSEILTTPEALEHTFQLRLMIEPAALLQKGYRLLPEEIARLRRVEEDLLSGGIERASPNALFDRTVQFHETLISGTQNPFLLETLRRVNRVRRLLIYQSMGNRERYFRQSEEHLMLLGHIEAARFEEAAQLMHAHISGVIGRLRAIGLLVEQESEAGEACGADRRSHPDRSIGDRSEGEPVGGRSPRR